MWSFYLNQETQSVQVHGYFETNVNSYLDYCFMKQHVLTTRWRDCTTETIYQVPQIDVWDFS